MVRALLDVLLWRRVPVRDARGRVKLVRLRSGPWVGVGTVLSGVMWSVIALCAGVVLGRWHVWIGVITGALVLTIPYALATFGRSRDVGRAYVRHCLLKDRCPWCDRLLSGAGEDNLRRCGCQAAWWDVPGLEPGTSVRKHTEHVLAINVGVVMAGLFFGWMQFAGMSSGPWEHRLLAGGLSLIFASGVGLMGAKGGDWRAAGVSAGVIPFVLGLFWLRGADAPGGAAMVVMGLVTGIATAASTRWVASRRRRHVRRGFGRVCADCGYDLRASPAGEPCPECGSRMRVR